MTTGHVACARTGSKPRGLYVWRGPGDIPFEPCEIKKLESIGGFVAHAMTRATFEEESFVDSDDRALFLADLDGTVRHARGQARHLLVGVGAALVPHSNWRDLHEPVPEIVRLCCSLAATANGGIGPPPVLRLRNSRGEFVLRAYWFGATDGAEQTSQIGITIERRVPRALALLRRVEDLPLTGREKQLCLLLARNLTGPDLGEALGVAASTVLAHQSSIYTKLGVHSRAGLLEMLQSP